jgi:wyosine [tRNA(Phe)-imidazoG37] synthetase (radical SAM superfamily)
MSPPDTQAATAAALAQHPRDWADFVYVYPVVSRRSHGLSLGINLQPSGACNFDCIYCCVDRSAGVKPDRVDLDRLRFELDHLLRLAASGAIWSDPRFRDVDTSYRRVNDIAFSGNGEPTISPAFPEAVDLAIDARQAAGFDASVKLVLITNATRLDRPRVAETLDKMDRAGGFEPWVKLDAGTADYYRRIDRSTVPFEKVLASILAFGQRHAVVVQTMLCRLEGEAMPAAEFDAYLHRLCELRDAGCRMQAVHLYTVARQTAEASVTPCTDEELEAYAAALREGLPEVRVATFPAPG